MAKKDQQPLKLSPEDNPFEIWERSCERAKNDVLSWPDPMSVGDAAIDAAEDLLAVARILRGVACPACQGHGSRAYGSTATWHGGIGGQQISDGVCDVCWGTGRTDRTGVDLRKLQYSKSI